ncbi:DUF4190 domain-containing protein [Cellulomonas fimi]|uniref:DUF4190 domain-containing protein n=1 Tax=Cellulomonas fimi TaxID=1708 RepID=UPI000F82D8FE|nr:DUF4190 domain-containing protein [Cellulomonas fimi]
MSTPEPPSTPDQPPVTPTDPTWAPPGSWKQPGASTPAPTAPDAPVAAAEPGTTRSAPVAAPAAAPAEPVVVPVAPAVVPAEPTASAADPADPAGPAPEPVSLAKQPAPQAGAYPPPGPGTAFPPAPASPSSTDLWGVFSFAAALVSLVCLGVLGPLAVVLGLVGIRRARNAGRPVSGFARSGVIIGLVETLLVAAAIVVVVLVRPADRIDDAVDPFDGTGQETAGPVYVLPLDLAAGTCFTGLPEADDLSDVTQVPCDEPHDTELTAVLPIDVPLDDMPFDQIAGVEAECMRTNGMFGTAPGEKATNPDSYGNYMTWPHANQWDEGGRAAYCLFGTPDGPTTGSLVAGTSELLP